MKEIEQPPILLPDENEIKGQKKPFQWGDELEVPVVKPESEDGSHSYTSVTKLLKDERKIEKKRLEEYFKKLSSI